MNLTDLSRPLALTFAMLALGACSDSAASDADDDDTSGGDSCSDGEVEMAHLDENAEGPSKCVAKPSECTGDDPCSIDACRGALYKLCDDGWSGVACSSSTGAAPIVSCNQ